VFPDKVVGDNLGEDEKRAEMLMREEMQASLSPDNFRSSAFSS
jgi:hypothetical protein